MNVLVQTDRFTSFLLFLWQIRIEARANRVKTRTWIRTIRMLPGARRDRVKVRVMT